MKISTSFSEPANLAGAGYRYGMLAVCLLLLVWVIQLRLALPPSYPYDPNGNGIVALMLLFNHLAYYFPWRKSVTVALRLLAWGWIAFGLFYLFYLSHVLYP